MAEFSINDKEKVIKIRLKDWDIAYEDSIENKEKDFYKKLRCIWKLDLPKEIKAKICEEYGKLRGQAILYENEKDYALEGMMDNILWEEYIVSSITSVQTGTRARLFAFFTAQMYVFILLFLYTIFILKEQK